MSLTPDSGEPDARSWRAKPLAAVMEALVQLGEERAKGGRGVVLAVDGRSSSGKTTLAARLREVVAGSAVVHTDDLEWWHSRFGWDDLLVDGVLVPFHCGEQVSFRPPRWAGHGRQGFIQVPARCPVLIIEGVGAGRFEVSHLIDALVWVQADQQEAERRSLTRVGQPGGPETGGDYRAWMAEEEPFLARQRPWERADMLVAGTPQIPFDPASEVVIAPPRLRVLAPRAHDECPGHPHRPAPGGRLRRGGRAGSHTDGELPVLRASVESRQERRRGRGRI